MRVFRLFLLLLLLGDDMLKGVPDLIFDEGRGITAINEIHINKTL